MCELTNAMSDDPATLVVATRPSGLIDWDTMNPLARMFLEWLSAALTFVVDLVLVPMLAATKYAESKAQIVFMLWYGPGILVACAQCAAAVAFIAVQAWRAMKRKEDALHT